MPCEHVTEDRCALLGESLFYVECHILFIGVHHGASHTVAAST